MNMEGFFNFCGGKMGKINTKPFDCEMSCGFGILSVCVCVCVCVCDCTYACLHAHQKHQGHYKTFVLHIKIFLKCVFIAGRSQFKRFFYVNITKILAKDNNVSSSYC